MSKKRNKAVDEAADAPPDFSKPTEVDQVSLAFPTSVRRMLPDYSTVPAEFTRGESPWCRLIRDWFFGGLKGYSFVPKSGIDPEKAIRHVAYCLGSWEPKHEHKEAGCAYLMSLWFERAIPPKKADAVAEDDRRAERVL